MVKVGDKGELEKKQTGETNKNEKKRNIKSTTSESDFINEKEKIIAVNTVSKLTNLFNSYQKVHLSY